MDTQTLTSLLAIADKAIEAHHAEARCKAERANLDEAYSAWKAKRDIDRIEPDTPQWEKMMKATKPVFRKFSDAKRDERNAKRRLASAIERHRALTN
jgi:hypothetical protein